MDLINLKEQMSAVRDFRSVINVRKSSQMAVFVFTSGSRVLLSDLPAAVNQVLLRFSKDRRAKKTRRLSDDSLLSCRPSSRQRNSQQFTEETNFRFTKK